MPSPRAWKLSVFLRGVVHQALHGRALRKEHGAGERVLNGAADFAGDFERALASGGAAVDQALRGFRVSAAHVVAGRVPADAVRRRRRSIVEVGDHRDRGCATPAGASGAGVSVAAEAASVAAVASSLLAGLPPNTPDSDRTSTIAPAPATIASVRFGRAPNNRNPLPCMRRIASRKNPSVIAGEHGDVAGETCPRSARRRYRAPSAPRW